jgi:hypothetical protein
MGKYGLKELPFHRKGKFYVIHILPMSDFCIEFQQPKEEGNWLTQAEYDPSMWAKHKVRYRCRGTRGIQISGQTGKTPRSVTPYIKWVGP